MPRRQLFGDVQRHRYLETGQIFFSEHGDGVNCSNFVDLDWLSSSGNSCEDEPFERYIFLFCISWMLNNSTYTAVAFVVQIMITSICINFCCMVFSVSTLVCCACHRYRRLNKKALLN